MWSRGKESWPNLHFVSFCMNGADDVVKYQKWVWAGPKGGRYIAIGRPGFTEEVVRGMQEAGVDAGDGYFILGPELPDISSTEARQALVARDTEKLAGLLHPRVTEWCLREEGPFKQRPEQ